MYVKSKLFSLTLFAIMFMSIAFSAEALATNSKVDLYSIIETYDKKIEKDKMDFFAAVKK